MTTNATAADSSGVVLDNLYRVILQCFVIIIFGYLAGRTGLITSAQASGIGTYVSKFSLPALLLKNMIELNFSQVNWMFLIGVLIAKCSVFILVLGLTIFVKHPIHLGYAGLFGIVATQSNDFAVGYPILEALYGKTHKDYLNYLYLVAPISLVVLNPIGFILLEIHKNNQLHEDGKDSDSGILAAFGRVLKGIFTNPIVLMTFVGIVGHFVFKGTVPSFLKDILQTLGNSYNATALFLLGLSMVGKIKGNMGISLLVPILLIVAKTLILPLIIWEVVGSLVDSTNGNGTSSLSMYGFIYGTFPAAPSVFLYAHYYGVAEDIVARTTVLGTFLSAPLMFASGKMMTMVVSEDMDHKEELREIAFDVSIVSLVVSVWVIGVFIAGRKWKLIPHRFTMALILSQIVACIGLMTYHTHGRHNANQVGHYPIIIFLLVGVFAARTWTAVLSVVMYFIRTRSLCFIIRHQVWFWFGGFGIPVMLTGIIFMVGEHDLTREVDPSFHFGIFQTIVSAVLLAVSLIITITCIVLWQRGERQHAAVVRHQQSPTKNISNHGSFDECEPIEALSTDTSTPQTNDTCDNSKDTEQDNVSGYQTLRKARSIEDLIPCENRENHGAGDSIMTDTLTERTCLLGECNVEERHECLQKLRRYVVKNLNHEDPADEFEIQRTEKLKDEYQTSHHLILLLVLILSMAVGLFLCSWRLSHSHISGIYLEMEFLDIFLNYGQGLIFLAVFGFDARLVFSPVIRRRVSKHRSIYSLYVRLRRWFVSTEVMGLPKSSQLDMTTKHICHQFTQYHQDNCARDIAKEFRSRVRVYKEVFTGTALCDWLIEAGLADDKEGAVKYGRHLLLGRVIAHVMGQHHFQDAPYYYRFVSQSGDNNC